MMVLGQLGRLVGGAMGQFEIAQRLVEVLAHVASSSATL
jgi:hypothetical protein